MAQGFGSLGSLKQSLHGDSDLNDLLEEYSREKMSEGSRREQRRKVKKGCACGFIWRLSSAWFHREPWSMNCTTELAPVLGTWDG